MNENTVEVRVGNSYAMRDAYPQIQAWDFTATFDFDSPVAEIMGVRAITQRVHSTDLDAARETFVQTCKDFLEDDGYEISLMTYAYISSETAR